MRRSAGILPYRLRQGVEVLIAHPGGPLWARKDAGAWSIVKGVVEASEDDLAAARREFAEETGWPPPVGPYIPLGLVRLRSGKLVVGWAAEYEAEPDDLDPGTFDMEWPPRSGRLATYPEIDRVAWHHPDEARRLLNTGQRAFVDRLIDLVAR